MTTEIFTIGVYGWEAEAFFAALVAARIDTFCDVRARRGVRGSEYVFANSNRLQAKLAELGIRYLHRPDLAPSKEARTFQHEIDEASGQGKRARSSLSPSFVDAYLSGPLAAFDSAQFVAGLGEETQRAALFCVEREASACHRGLLAARLQNDLNMEVTHLTP
jgi:uncharacterized protein (DUF488 family)